MSKGHINGRLVLMYFADPGDGLRAVAARAEAGRSADHAGGAAWQRFSSLDDGSPQAQQSAEEGDFVH